MRTLGVVLLLGSLAFAQQETAEPAAPAAPASTQADTAATEASPDTVTVSAGTKVPLVLKNAVSTKSAKPGDPVYLQTNFPITANDEIVIPAGTYVQGVITSVTRPGRIKGRAELLMHFNTMIFPNGYTVALPGAVDSVPGGDNTSIKDKEGTIQRDPEKGKDAATIAGTGATGALIGAAASGGKGALVGAAAGGVTGLAISMLSRGSDVRFEAGMTVEMVFQRPLTLEVAQLHRAGRNFVPVRPADRRLQPRPLTPPPSEPN